MLLHSQGNARSVAAAQVTVSIVSHRQNGLVSSFLDDLGQYCRRTVSIVLTENVADDEPLRYDSSLFEVHVVRNTAVKGFGANHNAAFQWCSTPFFCVANPDVRLTCDPFPGLIQEIEKSAAGVIGPLVRDSSGRVQDSARRFPTLLALAKRFRHRGPDYPVGMGAVDVDWVAGMFMLFSVAAFREVGGFDERYFMYYEDADICRRLRRRGMRVRYDPAVEIIHDARRGSRRNPRLAAHHAASILRFLAG